ncbi:MULTISPECIES: hypothetical protein [unclassified Enterococcus]|nr:MULTISPECIES: hypothetical protein [unclassified Enterococcus]
MRLQLLRQSVKATSLLAGRLMMKQKRFIKQTESLKQLAQISP